MDVQEVKEQLKNIFRMVINNDKWITIHPNGEDAKGKHLLLKDGESPKEAIDRTYGKKSDSKEKSILDTIKEREQQAKDLKEKGLLKDIKNPKTFEERQQEDINKGELVELGKFPSKFTSEYPKGFSGESQKKQDTSKEKRQAEEYKKLKDKIDALKFTRDSLKKDYQYLTSEQANKIYDKASELFKNHIIPSNLSDKDYKEIADIMQDIEDFVIDKNTNKGWGTGRGKLEAVQKALEKSVKESQKLRLFNGIKAIINNCKPETEQDYKVLRGLKEILENMGE